MASTSKRAAHRRIALTSVGGLRVAVHASPPGASQADAEAAALEALRRLTVLEGFTLEQLEQLTTDLVVIPEPRAALYYPRAMREWYKLEAAEADADADAFGA